MTHRGGIILLALLCALVALAQADAQGRDRPQSGWYSSRSQPRRPYTQPDPDEDPNEPSFGTREDYGSRPGFGRSRSRTGGSRRPVSGYRPPQPDRSRQPSYGGGYDPRQPYPPRQPPSDPSPPVYEPRPPVYEPRPPVYEPRPPVYEPRPPVYEPRQPVYPPRQPVYPPRQPVYPPRQPPSRPEYPQPEYPQPEYPQPEYPQPDFPQPGQPLDVDRADEKIILPIAGKYTGPDVLPHYGAPYPYLKGKEIVSGRGQISKTNCAPNCRGQCTFRDDDCNCVQNRTCFENLKHRLLVDDLSLRSPPVPEDCPNVVECGECGYTVQWPDGWCLCETDPNCTPRAGAAYTKREVDIQKLILQRDAHMAELKRASRHSTDN